MSKMPQKVKKAVFPVAGLATRFLPVTKTVPKELLPLAHKPLLQHAVDEAREAGIEKFVFVTSARKPAIEKHFAPQAELEAYLDAQGQSAQTNLIRECTLPPESMTVVYQEEPLGLGHAVLCARDHIGDEPFAVLLPDDMILHAPGALKQMADYFSHTDANLIAAMDVPDEETGRYGIIKGNAMDGHVKVSALVEKPPAGQSPSNTAIVGRYILQPEIFGVLDSLFNAADRKKELQLTDAIDALSRSQEVRGFRFKGERYDCGYSTGLLEASVAYALKDPASAEDLRKRLLRLLASDG